MSTCKTRGAVLVCPHDLPKGERILWQVCPPLMTNVFTSPRPKRYVVAVLRDVKAMDCSACVDAASRNCSSRASRHVAGERPFYCRVAALHSATIDIVNIVARTAIVIWRAPTTFLLPCDNNFIEGLATATLRSMYHLENQMS